MKRPELTEQAEADLDEAWAFVARDDPAAADRLIGVIHAAARQLAQFPESGRSREEFGADVRSLVASRYPSLSPD